MGLFIEYDLICIKNICMIYCGMPVYGENLYDITAIGIFDIWLFYSRLEN